MKKSMLLLISLFCCTMSFAQPPQGINNQAIVRNDMGELVTNAAIGIQVSILQGEIDGTAVYIETHAPESNTNGLVTYVIGKGTVVSGVFADIDWSDGPYFLKTEVDPEGGNSYSIEGTTQFHSVPYALHAQTTGDAFKGDMKGERIFNLDNPVNAQDATTKGYVDLLEERIIALELEAGILFEDIDGNHYRSVTIGDQVWMAENLKTTKYRDGSPIDNPTDDEAWETNTTGAYVWHENNDNWKDIYGALYNWYAVTNSKGLCPTGWHVPSDEEWTQLERYVCNQLGNEDCETKFPNDESIINWRGTNEGNALKSCRQVNSPRGGGCNTSAHPRWNEDVTQYGTDEFSFSALAGGMAFNVSFFSTLGELAAWWSTTEYSTPSSMLRLIEYYQGTIFYGMNPKYYGFSVRCVRDN